MAIWVLVSFWVVVGLGVFLVALRGGGSRRAGSGGAGGGSRGSRRATVLVSTLIFLVFGVAIPAIVLATNGDDKSKKGPGGVDLNAAQAHGRDLFAQNCSTCHT